jgi:hypothetical protein
VISFNKKRVFITKHNLDKFLMLFPMFISSAKTRMFYTYSLCSLALFLGQSFGALSKIRSPVMSHCQVDFMR